MSFFSKSTWLSLLCVCSVSAQADEVKVVDNPYALKKPRKAADNKPEAAIDQALVRAVVARIGECYTAEQHAPLSEEDRKLLESSGEEAVRELESAFRFSSCQIDKAASPRCIKDMASMECATLAEPIVAAGWDRHLTPEAKAQVKNYASALALREASCNGLSGEEASIVTEIRVDKVAVLIEAQIVMGQCRIMPDEQVPCDAELKSLSCDEVLSTSNRGEIQKLCPALLLCTETPKVEDEK